MSSKRYYVCVKTQDLGLMTKTRRQTLARWLRHLAADLQRADEGDGEVHYYYFRK